MKPDSEQLRLQMERFKEGLRRSGMKRTPQRIEVFRELAKSGNHPHAEAIFKGVRKRVPTISQDTVYRTLWLLLDLGLISTLGSRDRVRFDGNTKPHHHYVCRKCGMTSDFYNEDYDHLDVPESVRTLGSVEKTQVEIKGFCRRCSEKMNSRGNK
jgi:Fur family peroxide stress response transcriptional regulator